MKTDPRLTVKYPAPAEEAAQSYYRYVDNTEIPITQLVNGAIVSNIKGLLQYRFSLALGYRYGNTLGLFSDLPPKIGRSKDLAYILGKIATVNGSQICQNRVFSAYEEDVNYVYNHLYPKRFKTLDLIVEILNSNRTPFIKLALLKTISELIDHKLLENIIYSGRNCVLIYELVPSDKTFEDLMEQSNMLELLRDDQYMSSILTKFRLIGPEINKQYPELYKSAAKAINNILKADEYSDLFSSMKDFYNDLLDHVKDIDAPKIKETIESVYGLDCGCEHQIKHPRDGLIGEIIFALYKLKAA